MSFKEKLIKNMVQKLKRYLKEMNELEHDRTKELSNIRIKALDYGIKIKYDLDWHLDYVGFEICYDGNVVYYNID